MKTLIIVASLFSVQPAPAQLDSQWLDLQSIRDQVQAYVAEDVASVSKMIKSTLQEGVNFGDKLYEYIYEPMVRAVNKDEPATSEEESTNQVN